jgi:diguanylate cyclase
MSDGYQFGIHILFIVAVAQFVFGAAAMWLFGGSSRPETSAPDLVPDVTELEALRGRHRDDQKALERAMEQIHALTGQIGENVGQHNARVQQINDELADASARGDDAMKDSLLATIQQITEANAKLQGELQSAKSRMAEQAEALQSQMAMARTDALTGALNRRAFDDEFGRRVSEFQRYRTPVSLLLFDIDHFKKFNDTYGHQTGDEVLRHTAGTLAMVMRDVDLVCRYGGEEFAVILPATDLSGAILAAERARAAVERMVVESDGQQLKVTASCGVASVLPNEDVAGVIARADQGLYGSKKAGRNCVHLHDGNHLQRYGADGATTESSASPAPAAANKAAAAKAADQADDDAFVDPLQLLPNREAFTEEVRRRIEQHQRRREPVTIVYGGVDKFNTFTAKHGRESGNVLLRAVAQYMKAVLRDQEMLARVADDQFAIILGGIDAQETIARVARITNGVQKCRLPVDGLQNARFTVSFGLAEFEAGNDADTLMQRGIKAFAVAAAEGNCVRIESASTCHGIEAVGAGA